jgi:hypothetical protein
MTFDDPMALVPEEMDGDDARRYEHRVLELLREHFVGAPSTGILVIDDIELVGSRPDTLVVFRYHHPPEYVGQHPDLVEGQLVEIYRLWEDLLDESEQPYRRGMIDGPGQAAVSAGSAFTATELMIADPETFAPIRRAPAIFRGSLR